MDDYLEDRLEDLSSGKISSQAWGVVRANAKELRLFLLKAVVLVALLAVVAKYATVLPAMAFPFVFLLYAAPATLGAMYGIVVKRFHDQSKYNEEGILSRYNRKWTCWMLGFLVVSLVSAFVFVLDAPVWDEVQWCFIFLAVPLYCIVFQFVKIKSRKQYSSTYFKKRAIFWSSLIVTVLLSLLYVAATMGSSPGAPVDLLAAIEGRYMPFAESPCALLVEADKLNSYSNCLIKYGFSCIEESARTAVFLVFAAKVLLNASVFFGFANLLGVCTLSLKEIGSEFRRLPTGDDFGDIQPLRPVYFSVIFWILTCFSVF